LTLLSGKQIFQRQLRPEMPLLTFGDCLTEFSYLKGYLCFGRFLQSSLSFGFWAGDSTLPAV
jgi:hypothetical protein